MTEIKTRHVTMISFGKQGLGYSAPDALIWNPYSKLVTCRVIELEGHSVKKAMSCCIDKKTNKQLYKEPKI
jgi:hypothetical protein